MSKTRVIIKRPLIHYLISAAYILAPVVNILLLVFIERIPLPDIMRRLFQGYGVLAAIWLLTAPLVGVGLYFVHKASWYLFLAHSALILADYVAKWMALPAYYWMSVGGFHQFLLLTGNLALVAIIGFIINKDFRSPYFQVLPRGWRTSHRVLIRHRILLNGRSVDISDLSDDGCFVAAPDLEIAPGDRLEVSFQADRLSIACGCEIMRRTPGGYGLRFVGVTAAQKRDIRRMIGKRFPFRFAVDLQGHWVAGGQERPVRIRDFSRTGCYLEAEVAGLKEGDRGELDIPEHRRQAELAAAVVWVNPEELHGKPVGFGVRFAKSQGKLSAKVVKLQKERHAAG